MWLGKSGIATTRGDVLTKAHPSVGARRNAKGRVLTEPDPYLGRYLGGCRIEREIGRGGMGVVYRGVDDHLGRKVAVKILPYELTRDPEYLARFKREARAAGRLDHPHIATVYQVGEEDGIHYIVMQYADRGSLADRLRVQRALTEADAVRFFDELLQALDVAHNAGIVHRDIKPENILLTASGRSLLADFGVARDSKASTVLTQVVGTQFGSPYYMAPELWQGGAATPQSDLFAAGVTFYYMLTGVVPFSGASPTDIMRAVTTGEPDLRWVTTPQLRECLGQLLAKNPFHRIPNAHAAREAIAGGVAVAPASYATSFGQEDVFRRGLLGLRTSVWRAGRAVLSLLPRNRPIAARPGPIDARRRKLLVLMILMGLLLVAGLLIVMEAGMRW